MSFFSKSMMLGSVLVAGSLFAGVGAAYAGNDHHVTIDNRTDTTLTNFYIAKAHDPYWSDDYLGDETINSGYHMKLNLDDGSGACMYDFKAVFSDHTSLIRRDVNVCQIGRFTYTSNN